MNDANLNTAIDTLVDLAKNSEDDSVRLQAASSLLSFAHIQPSTPTGQEHTGQAGTNPPQVSGIDPEMASGPGNTDEPSEPTVEPEAVKKKSAKKKKS